MQPDMVWSGNDKWLAYSVHQSDELNIKIVNWQGDIRRTLFSLPYTDQWPDLRWSPDGTMLAVVLGSDRQSLDVINTKGLRLYHLDSLQGEVTWTPCQEPETAIF